MHRTGSMLSLIAILAFWLGAALLFSAVVAPAVFAVLPTRTLAGAVVACRPVMLEDSWGRRSAASAHVVASVGSTGDPR